MKPNPPIKPNRAIKLLLLPLLALTLLPTAASAEDLPRKAPLGKYAGLWNNSPFTSRPVVEQREPEPEDNPLDDYALTGVSPVADGFRVTLINRNDPTERIVVDSTRATASHDFQILNINRSVGRPLSTTVELTDGNFTSTIAFEQELLALKPPPAAPQQPPQNVPGINPGDAQQEQPQGARRQPRPRVVPPPPANAQQQQQGAANQRGRGQRTQGTRERTDRRSRR